MDMGIQLELLKQVGAKAVTQEKIGGARTDEVVGRQSVIGLAPRGPEIDRAALLA